MEGWLVPLVQQLGLGGITGAVAGFAFKKMAKVFAVILGLLFIVLQLLAYNHFISINWGEIGSAAGPHVATGGKGAAAAIWRVLTHNIPFGASFAGGFFLGFKKG